MTDFFLQLLGAWGDRAGSIVWSRSHVDLQGTLAGGWLFLILLLLAALTIWLYRREADGITPFQRYGLAAARIAFFALILGLLLRPVLTLTLAGSIRQSLLVLVDASKSMQIGDLRLAPEDLKRAAIATGALDPGSGLDQPIGATPAGVDRITRVELIKSALSNEKINLLKRLSKEYDIIPFTFDSALRESGSAGQPNQPNAPPDNKPKDLDSSWVSSLNANGPSTALGLAITEAIYRKRGQPVAGILVATDGASNTGNLPLEAAKVAKTEGVPLYTWGVGISNPRDIIVTTLFSQDVAFVKDQVTASVRVKSQGLKGQTAQLVLTLDGRKMDEKTVTFGDNDEQTIEMKFIPDALGEFQLVASIAPRPDEVSASNNSASHHLRVIDGRIRVLHVEQWPRFEYKFLQSQLLRDRRVEYRTILMEADPAVSQTPGTPYLKSFPERREDLLKYDLVIIGDVDPKRLPAGAMANLSDFVTKFGGSVAVIAGRTFMPLAYRRGPLEKMLPVDTDIPQMASLASGTKAIKLELTPAGKDNPMLLLADSPELSAKLWEKFPPIYWDYRVSTPKPGAQVLLADSDPTKASRFGKMPVIALQQYGLGQVMWVGTDNLWRLRRNANDVLYNRLWAQIVERMALAHMLGASKRTQLAMEKQVYSAGDRVTVYARLYDRDFTAINSPTVRGSLRGTKGGPEIPFTLRQQPGQDAQDGTYRGEFVAPAAGDYLLSVESDPETSLQLSVTEPQLEMGETAMNEALLRDMATTSGGLFLREEDLTHLPEKIHSTSQPVYSTVDVQLWSSPLYFLILISVVSVEWLFRRLLQMR